MHRKLILKAFEKAKKEEGTSIPSRLATCLSDFILEDSKQPYGERSLRKYHKIAKRNTTAKIEIKPYVVQALCTYLGYEDYKHFLGENPDENTSKKNKIILLYKRIAAIGSIVIIFLIGYFIFDFTKKDCMIWINDRYERVKCEEKNDVKSIPYNKVVLENLRRVEPDRNYPFFKPDGSENLWYERSAEGELQYFTYHGIHPETGETLKKITWHMINKYILNENNNK